MVKIKKAPKGDYKIQIQTNDDGPLGDGRLGATSDVPARAPPRPTATPPAGARRPRPAAAPRRSRPRR